MCLDPSSLLGPIGAHMGRSGATGDLVLATRAGYVGRRLVAPIERSCADELVGRENGSFKAAVAAPEGASAIDQRAAFAGRTPMHD